jgi:hypothetical protein
MKGNTVEAIYKEFLTSNNYFIDFNGIEYTLVDKNQNVIVVTNSPENMFNFILGYNRATQELLLTIDSLNKRNEDNIKRYEKIIKDMGEESLI